MKTNKKLYLIYIRWLGSIFYSCRPQAENKTTTSPADSSSGQFGCCTPEVVDTTWYASGKKAPLFSGLEGLNFPISTKNSEAQQYFDQGLLLSFAFNHAEAGRSFFEAAQQDSACAMCWWGFAYLLGPNYNAGNTNQHDREWGSA
jgi:hypothetical protein